MGNMDVSNQPKPITPTTPGENKPGIREKLSEGIKFVQNILKEMGLEDTSKINKFLNFAIMKIKPDFNVSIKGFPPEVSISKPATHILTIKAVKSQAESLRNKLIELIKNETPGIIESEKDPSINGFLKRVKGYLKNFEGIDSKNPAEAQKVLQEVSSKLSILNKVVDLHVSLKNEFNDEYKVSLQFLSTLLIHGSSGEEILSTIETQAKNLGVFIPTSDFVLELVDQFVLGQNNSDITEITNKFTTKIDQLLSKFHEDPVGVSRELKSMKELLDKTQKFERDMRESIPNDNNKNLESLHTFINNIQRNLANPQLKSTDTLIGLKLNFTNLEKALELGEKIAGKYEQNPSMIKSAFEKLFLILNSQVDIRKKMRDFADLDRSLDNAHIRESTDYGQIPGRPEASIRQSYQVLSKEQAQILSSSQGDFTKLEGTLIAAFTISISGGYEKYVSNKQDVRVKDFKDLLKRASDHYQNDHQNHKIYLDSISDILDKISNLSTKIPQSRLDELIQILNSGNDPLPIIKDLEKANEMIDKTKQLTDNLTLIQSEFTDPARLDFLKHSLNRLSEGYDENNQPVDISATLSKLEDLSIEVKVYAEEVIKILINQDPNIKSVVEYFSTKLDSDIFHFQDKIVTDVLSELEGKDLKEIAGMQSVFSRFAVINTLKKISTGSATVLDDLVDFISHKPDDRVAILSNRFIMQKVLDEKYTLLSAGAESVAMKAPDDKKNELKDLYYANKGEGKKAKEDFVILVPLLPEKVEEMKKMEEELNRIRQLSRDLKSQINDLQEKLENDPTNEHLKAEIQKRMNLREGIQGIVRQVVHVEGENVYSISALRNCSSLESAFEKIHNIINALATPFENLKNIYGQLPKDLQERIDQGLRRERMELFISEMKRAGGSEFDEQMYKNMTWKEVQEKYRTMKTDHPELGLKDGMELFNEANNKFAQELIDPQKIFKQIMNQAAEGISSLHLLGKVHHDIAARNFLVSFDLNAYITASLDEYGKESSGNNPGLKVVLADIFGMYQIDTLPENVDELMDRADNFGHFKSNTVPNPKDTGPLRWMAPESVAKKKVGYQTDTWMLGIASIEIACFFLSSMYGKRNLSLDELQGESAIQYITKLVQSKGGAAAAVIIDDMMKSEGKLIFTDNFIEILKSMVNYKVDQRSTVSEVQKKLQDLKPEDIFNPAFLESK